MGIDKKTRDIIKVMFVNGHSCVEIASKLGIAESVIRHVVSH